MKPTKLKSSMIQEISHEGDTLHVTFAVGSQYAFEKVPEKVAEGLSKAKSAGQYFNAHIRNKFKQRGMK